MRFRVLTYNVHQCVGTDGHRDPARVAEVIRHHDPDVVCLQEVVWHEHEHTEHVQPRRLADTLGYAHGAVGLYRNLKGGAWGNVTLSRFPVHEPETIDLSLRVRFRRTRGALYTQLHVHGRHVHLFNLHFGLAGFERALQIERVLGRADEVAPHGGPVVLVGDTNDWRNKLVRGALAEEGFVAATCHAKDPGPPTYPSTDPVAALDKMFIRGHVRAVRASVSRLALARLASDHLPVLVELELTS
jgi:endonuclease/exonuclease/phosphatase family metal-dependent hydrolase